jgi:hypothetical protein
MLLEQSITHQGYALFQAEPAKFASTVSLEESEFFAQEVAPKQPLTKTS